MMIEVARVVPDLVHMRSHHCGQSVAFLQIDRKIGRSSLPDSFQSLSILGAIHRDAHHSCTGAAETFRLLSCGFHILGFGGTHALAGDRVAAANRDRADADRAGRISLYHTDHCSPMIDLSPRHIEIEIPVQPPHNVALLPSASGSSMTSTGGEVV